MHVLVTYGSKMGGTEGLAEMLGAELTDLGHEIDVRAASEVANIGPFDAVIVGGALYYFVSWHKDARAFANDTAPRCSNARSGCLAAVRSMIQRLSRRFLPSSRWAS